MAKFKSLSLSRIKVSQSTMFSLVNHTIFYQYLKCLSSKTTATGDHECLTIFQWNSPGSNFFASVAIYQPFINIIHSQQIIRFIIRVSKIKIRIPFA